MNYFGVLFYVVHLLVVTGAFLLLRRGKNLSTVLMVAGTALNAVPFPLEAAKVFLPRFPGLQFIEQSPWISLIGAGLFALGFLGYARGELRAQTAAMDEQQRAAVYARRFFGLPRSALGWWSVWVAFGFFVFMTLFWQQAGRPGRDRSTFFSDPVNAACLIGAFGSALVGMLLAVVAMVWKRERSWAMYPVILSGLHALIWTVAALGGGNP